MEEQLVYNNDILKDVPIYDKCHSFLRKVSEKDYPGMDFFNPSEFIAQVFFWLDKSREYRYKGKQNECDHIMSVVKELWKSFKNKGMVLSESDELNVEILEEDYFSVS